MTGQEDARRPEEARDDVHGEQDGNGADAAGGAEERIAALEAGISELRGQLLRAVAEEENVRRRLEREKEDAARFAIRKFARDLLSVVDNFDRATNVADHDSRSFREGILAIARELSSVLVRHGVCRMKVSGVPFDARWHQAAFEVERDDVAPGTIVEVAMDGYTLSGQLLRAAMVGVARMPGPSGEAGPAAPGTGTTDTDG